MTELLQKLKLRVKNIEELLLIDLINDTIEEIRDFTRQPVDYVIDNMQSIVADMVVIKCNRLGNEGITNISISGANEAYETDIPTPIKKRLYSHRRARK